MRQFTQITFGDVGRGLARYKPAALTLAVIAVAALALPAPPQSEAADVSALTEGLEDATLAAPALGPVGEGSVAGPAPSSPVLTLPPSPSFSVEPSFSSSDSNVAAAPDPGSFEAEIADPAAGAGAEEEPPMTIRGAGWAAKTGATPVATADVPEDTLPVSVLVGQPDKVSFVRLAGTGSTLVLTEDPEGARAPTGGTAAVKACRITDPSWQEADNQAFTDAPAYDEEQCVEGVLDGTAWAFDLSAFPDRADDAGFALVPGEGAAVDFQVTFRRS